MGLSRVRRIDSTHIGLGVGVIPLKVNGEWTVRAITAEVSLLVTGGAGSGPVDATGAGANGGAASAATKYYIYAYDNAGATITTLSATGRATDTTYGAEIKSGDATRTLVGMCYLGAGPVVVDTVTQRFLISWFDLQNVSGFNSFSTPRSTTSGEFVEINSEIRVEYLTWSKEAVFASYSGALTNGTGAAVSYSALGFDSTSSPTGGVYATQPPTPIEFPVTVAAAKSGLSEGYHYVTVIGGSGSGTGTTTWATYGGTGLSVLIRG